MRQEDDNSVLFGNGDELPSNHSSNPHFNQLIETRLARRQVLAGGAALGALAFFGAAVPGISSAAPAAGQPQSTPPFRQRSKLPFSAVAVSRGDDISVPDGYKASPFIPWGTPITGSYPAFLEDASNSAEDQAQQTGMHHDGMHFFPIDAQRGPGRDSEHGLLVLNHEYIDVGLIHPKGPTVVDGKRISAEEVRKEINAHGVSVVEIRRNPQGDWEVLPSARNRRITAATPMQIRGPARGHALLRTRYSPDGTATRGTQNNCANGFTPWGTYLTCEENWAGYFASRDTQLPRELSRYGLRDSSRYGWETLAGDEFERFDATRKAASAEGDYRNEPNHFGWIVEIDPFAPESAPVKRTALGRFAHEGLVFAPVKPGRPVVCYSGDDSQNEYIYKYVSRHKYRPGRSDGSLLDDGTLYVARFDGNGKGKWLALDIHDKHFQRACLAAGVSFADQGEVLINTRLAADIVGATKMDRPEWGAVNPDNGEVYFTLTNNKSRSETDAANPRPANAYGHIIRWRERSWNSAGRRFSWDLFLLAGPENDSVGPNGQPLGADNLLASPDGLWFDPEGRLWIQTDMSGSQLHSGPFGNNQMLVADPASGEMKRFLVGPQGAEVTGISATPDFRTLFVNIQHPGEGSTADKLLSTWPDGPGKRPRSSTLVITREDGRRLL
ncbi:PhoX family phosphatase [Pseudomonas sp. LPB0260]|uniref:PhoX family protein n=1 Tax=Pseudomonas sp. LPB0260 TaxID=2614442 RepID=UPI0015C22E4F|nr:PhoX family phosphatase [Pseudomonas sp. LPB0260]QLC72410.1 PhoX family phosphatase [Pseudomonas sp. LPB0260]QLC75186.1 PhoX family phosphatase [Pseudomonas sp. LPB0260]